LEMGEPWRVSMGNPLREMEPHSTARAALQAAADGTQGRAFGNERGLPEAARSYTLP